MTSRAHHWRDGALPGVRRRAEGVRLRRPSAGMPVDVDVPLSGVDTLSLRVGDGGDGSYGDRGDWADAQVTCG
ncbi:NPCBM/NEW2 domain-containing protein [Actinopolymorpha singaporensis]